MIAVAAAMRPGRDEFDIDMAREVAVAAGQDAGKIDSAIAHGALARDKDTVSFGIPSFRNYMQGLVAQEQAQQRPLVERGR